MYGYILQDWITIRGNSAITTITQSEPDWLGLAAYQDIVFWLDCRELTLGGATNIQMNYETSPTKDDSLFVAMTAASNIAAATTPAVTKILLSQNPTVPLGRWVRWRLSVSGAATSSWD